MTKNSEQSDEDEWQNGAKTNGNKKAQLSLTNPRDASEKFARFT